MKFNTPKTPTDFVVGSKPYAGQVEKPLTARMAYPVAIIMSLVWAGSAVMFAIGYQSRDWAFDFKPVQVGLLTVVAVLPAVLMIIVAHTLKESAALTEQARLSRQVTDDLVAPVVLAAGVAGNVVEGVRHEIERAREITAAAVDQLSELRLALAEETERMSSTVTAAERAARLLTEGLGNERLEMGILSAELDSRASEVAGAIQRQAKMVSEASDLAQTQIREAEAALAARAADLAAAAADAGELGALASQQLSLNAERLETVGEAVGERLGALWTGLAREREQFVALSDTLSADQNEVMGRLTTQRSQLIDAVAQARVGSQEIHAAATSSSESLRKLIAEAAAQVGALAETARAEQEAIDGQARARLKLFAEMVSEERAVIEAESRAALSALGDAAEQARETAAYNAQVFRDATLDGAHAAINLLTDAAEQTRESARRALEETAAAAAAQTDSAKARMDQLGEVAFTAAQKADEIFETRFSAARRMIEESSRLVEDAGARSAQKIEVSLSATRNAVAELEALLNDLGAHAGRLPSEAHANVEAVRTAGARRGDDHTHAARQAAEETQLIDAAFQERVRHNYEMLSESVRLMTKMAGTTDTAAKAKPSAPVTNIEAISPTAELNAARIDTALSEGVGSVEAVRVAAGGGRFSTSVGRPRDAATSETEENDPPLTLGEALRPRLRLTQTEQDREVTNVFEQARADREREPGEPWTWRDLLKTVDSPPANTAAAATSDDGLSGRLRAEIEALGVDSSALLPRSRVDDIARALEDGDLDAGRETVRRLAPAAVRRLTRRMDMDPALKIDAQRFVGRFGNQVVEALSGDAGSANALLSSDSGRVFLLLDAAVSPAAG